MNTEGNMNLEPAQREMVAFWNFGALGCSRNTVIRSVLMWTDVK